MFPFPVYGLCQFCLKNSSTKRKHRHVLAKHIAPLLNACKTMKNQLWITFALNECFSFLLLFLGPNAERTKFARASCFAYELGETPKSK